ncbi:uncharacterized protein LOC144579231 isoform X1 [Callithrix jacchus]
MHIPRLAPAAPRGRAAPTTADRTRPRARDPGKGGEGRPAWGLPRLPAAVHCTRARPSPSPRAARSPVTGILTPGAQPRLPRRPKNSDTLSLSGPGRRTTGGEAGFTHAQRERRRPIPEVLRDSVKDVGECGVRGVERLYHPFKSMPLNSKLPGSSS